MGGFQTLVYTDCRPGDGLTGGTGLQFQAASAGANAEAMSLVLRHLLYEPPARWMRQHRRVEDYPGSLAHLWDGQLITASGVYLGREIDGNREGNQLTHAIVTGDPEAYGSIRPAQLMGSAIWVDHPVPGLGAPTIPDPPVPGPLDAETVREFVRAQPDGCHRLASLLTELSTRADSGPRQLVFLADQPAQVLSWLSAATLLLPQSRALRIGFKVFVSDLTRARARVVAIHPEWCAQAVRSHEHRGRVVIDLLEDQWPAMPVSEQARGWASLFCSEDPYDVTDAVELADASGLAGPESTALALAGVLGHPPPAHYLPAIATWLDRGPRPLALAYGPAVVGSVMSASGQAEVRNDFLDRVRDSLANDLLTRRLSLVDTGDMWWESLLETVRDLSNPLDEALASAAMAHSGREGRLRLLDRLLAVAVAGHDPVRAIQSLTRGLWLRTPATCEESRRVAEATSSATS